MIFEDLLLIQQVGVIKNLMRGPTDTYANPMHIPGTDYVIETDYTKINGTVIHVYLLDEVVDEMAGGSTAVTFWYKHHPNRTLKVNVEFRYKDKSNKVDDIKRFNLDGHVDITGNLEYNLRRINKMFKGFENLFDFDATPSSVIERMLETVPLARDLPDFVFETLLINESVSDTQHKLTKEIDTQVWLTQSSPIVEGTVHIRCDGDGASICTTSYKSQTLGLTVDFGSNGMDVIRVGYYVHGIYHWSPRLTFDNHETSTDYIIDAIRNYIVETTEKSKQAVGLKPLLDHYLTVFDSAVAKLKEPVESESCE